MEKLWSCHRARISRAEIENLWQVLRAINREVERLTARLLGLTNESNFSAKSTIRMNKMRSSKGYDPTVKWILRWIIYVPRRHHSGTETYFQRENQGNSVSYPNFVRAHAYLMRPKTNMVTPQDWCFSYRTGGFYGEMGTVDGRVDGLCEAESTPHFRSRRFHALTTWYHFSHISLMQIVREGAGLITYYPPYLPLSTTLDGLFSLLQYNGLTMTIICRYVL